MTAHYASTAVGKIRVWCDDPACPRPLDLEVVTAAHANNLAAKHDREHHPNAAPTVPGEDPAPVTSYDVSAVARLVVESSDHLIRWPGIRATEAHGVAINLWCALTGESDAGAALVLARELAHRHVTAHAAPF